MGRSRINIAIDGHSSAGKSTMAKSLAKELNYVYIDTGAMYRAATLHAMRERSVVDTVVNEVGLRAGLDRMFLAFRYNPQTEQSEIHLNGINVEKEIRSMEVASKVSLVARVPEVRTKLVAIQQRMAEAGGVVMDGRDIGTVVLPQAELKVFMTADPETRAYRRLNEMKENGKDVSYDEVLENVLERDRIDSERAVAPSSSGGRRGGGQQRFDRGRTIQLPRVVGAHPHGGRRLMGRMLYTFLALLSLAGCNRAQDTLETTGPIQPAFLSADSLLVDSILGTLSMEEQVAQLLMVPIYARTDTAGWAEAERWTRDLGLGGVICMQGGPEHQRTRLKRLQEKARVPLMVASDAEWGLGMRLDSTRSFPRAMTLGATRNPELVRLFGQVVGQSLRATGVHVNFAPVIDVNSNPLNPVIGSRSFGESVPWVSRLGQAYADGLQDVHVLATAKHFPGHGDSDSDSHKTLPTISHPRARLDSIELAPFAHAFDHGMGAVMVAHLDIPSLDSTEAQPSTLSPLIVDSLLRGEMGFEGLVFTDAMSMKGFADFVGDRPRIRDAILAGNDVLLFPGDPEAAIAETMAALADGTLDSASVTHKCRRVLMAKLWCRAQDSIPPAGTPWEPAHADVIHRELIAQSLTVLPGLDSASRAPLLATSGRLAMLDLANHEASCAPLEAQLRAHLRDAWEVTRHVLGKDGSGLGREAVKNALGQADHIVVTASEMSHRPSRNFGLQTEGVSALVQSLSAEGIDARRVTLVWMGNPYALKDLAALAPHVQSIMVAYQDDARTCEAVADALVGVTPVHGKLPVSPMDAPWREGDGLSWEGHQRLGKWVDARERSMD